MPSLDSQSIFISSCSRRQLARRRPLARGGALRLQFVLVLLMLVVAFGAVVAMRGGI